MAKFGIKTTRNEVEELPWHTYIDEGDGDPIEFQIGAWTRTAQDRCERQGRDKEFIRSLGLKWHDRLDLPSDDPEYGRGCWMIGDQVLPYGSGDRANELRTILWSNHLIRNWRNVVGEDGKTPLECDLFAKVWAMERNDLSLWVLHRAQEGGAKLVKAEQKNS
jgi:hypothetical protein